MRTVYGFDEKGKLVELKDRAPVKKGPAIIQDSMDAVVHPCDGRHYDSKSAFRRVTKANGCVEMGNDKPTASKPDPRIEKEARREAIARAYNQVVEKY